VDTSKTLTAIMLMVMFLAGFMAGACRSEEIKIDVCPIIKQAEAQVRQQLDENRNKTGPRWRKLRKDFRTMQKFIREECPEN